MERIIRHEEAIDILGAWADRRLHPLFPRTSAEPDFSLDTACDKMLLGLADDPEADLSATPAAVIHVAWHRLLFCAVRAKLSPDEVILRLDQEIPQTLVLQVLIGGYLAGARVPQEARAAGSSGDTAASPEPDRWH